MTERQTLYVAYSTTGGYSRDPDPEDNWDAGDQYQQQTTTGVYLDSVGYCDTVEVVGDPVVAGDEIHIVKQVYETGSTFGRSTGHVDYSLATKDPKLAYMVERAVEEGHKIYGTFHGYRRPAGKKEPKAFTVDGVRFRYDSYSIYLDDFRISLSGAGYFEALTDVTVETFRVGRGGKATRDDGPDYEVSYEY